MYDIISGNGMCSTIYGMGNATTTETNIKLVSQDSANHCGACGSAPIHRDNGNKLSGGWLETQAVGSDKISSCNQDRAHQFGLCASV